MDFCELTRQLWQSYLTGHSVQELEALAQVIDPECVVIGTGKHEFYTNIQQFAEALKKEKKQVERIQFHVIDQWYEELPLGEDARLVYGGIHIRDEEKGTEALIDMDTRFSVVYRKGPEGWRVVHIHQSLPYREQGPDEYYPKALTEKVREAQSLVDHMRKLVKQDPVTSLYNHRAFFEESEQALQEPNSYFMMLDLDDFKGINDTYGHLVGDDILKQTGVVLRSIIRRNDIVGRIGGDEFALLCANVASDEAAGAIAERIVRDINRTAGKKISKTVKISIGIAKVQPGQSMREVFQQADEALYQVKRSSKNGYAIYQEPVGRAEKEDGR